MKKKVIKLNEKELENLVRKIINEDNGDWSEDKEEEYRSDDPDQLDLFPDTEAINVLVEQSKYVRNSFISELPFIVDEMEEAAYGAYWDDVESRIDELEGLHEELKKISPHHPELEEIEKYASDMNHPEELVLVKIRQIS